MEPSCTLMAVSLLINSLLFKCNFFPVLTSYFNSVTFAKKYLGIQLLLVKEHRIHRPGLFYLRDALNPVDHHTMWIMFYLWQPPSSPFSEMVLPFQSNSNKKQEDHDGPISLTCVLSSKGRQILCSNL